MKEKLSFTEKAPLRYPGGEVTSQFHWEKPNGIGWLDSWKNNTIWVTSRNWMSVDEYFKTLQHLNTEGMLGINLHSGWQFNRVLDGLKETEGLAAKAFRDGANIKYWFFDNEQYLKKARWEVNTYCDLANRHGKRVIKFFPYAKFVVNWNFLSLNDWEQIIHKCKYVDAMDGHFYWNQDGWGTATWDSYIKRVSGPLTFGPKQIPIQRLISNLKNIGNLNGKKVEVGFHEWGVGPVDNAPIMSPFQYAFVVADIFMHMIDSKLDNACYWPLRENIEKPSITNGNRSLINEKNEPTVVHLFFTMFEDIKEYKLVQPSSTFHKSYTIVGLSRNKKKMIIYILHKDSTGLAVSVDIPNKQFRPKTAYATSYYAPRKNTISKHANISHPPTKIFRSSRVNLHIPAWSLTRIVLKR